MLPPKGRVHEPPVSTFIRFDTRRTCSTKSRWRSGCRCQVPRTGLLAQGTELDCLSAPDEKGFVARRTDDYGPERADMHGTPLFPSCKQLGQPVDGFFALAALRCSVKVAVLWFCATVSVQVSEASKWAVAGDSEGGVNSSYCEDGLSLKPEWKGRKKSDKARTVIEGTCTWRASRCGRQIAANNDINAHTRGPPYSLPPPPPSVTTHADNDTSQPSNWIRERREIQRHQKGVKTPSP